MSGGSLGHGIHFEITLRRNPKSIGHPIEEGKHRRDIHGFGDLGLAPSMIRESARLLVLCDTLPRSPWRHIQAARVPPA